MSVKDTILPFEMSVFNAVDLDGTYQAINPDGFPYPCCFIRIINDTVEDILISYDGVTNHEWIEGGDRSTHYFQLSNRPCNDVSTVTKGTILYVNGPLWQKGGAVYLVGYYRPQS